MRIGIDFDNTIARYDAIFARLGRQFHWLPDDFAGTKLQSRDLVRGGVDGEQRWQTLQALAYGPHMAEAELFDGVICFTLTVMESVFILQPWSILRIQWDFGGCSRLAMLQS